MEKKEPEQGYQRQEDGGRIDGSRPAARSDREDPARNNDQAYKDFTKDKRTRIPNQSTEKVEYRPRRDYDPEGGGRPDTDGEAPRRQFDNEGRGGSSGEYRPRREYGGQGGDYQNRPRRDYNSSSGGYGNRSDSESRPRNDYGNNRGDYGDRRRTEYDNRPRYNGEGRENTQRRDYDNRRTEGYGNRPEGYGGDSRQSYGNRSDSGNRPRNDYGNRSEGYGNRQSQGYGNRSQNDYDNRRREGHTPRPQGEGYVNRQHGEGGERRSYNPNFSHDNRPKFDKPRQEGGQYRNNNSYGDRKPSGDDRQGGNYRGGSSSYGQRREGGSYNGGQSRGYNNNGGYNNNRYGADGRPGGRPSQGGYNADRKPRSQRDDYPVYESEQTGDIRLNRYIAMSGICSRREADEFIKSGTVTVNGEVVTEMGHKVSPGDEVRFNGNVLKNEKKVYIVMNKPKGFVTSVEDPHADKTVIDLLGDKCRERVYPVGRLDKNSLGVLLITNDGDIAKTLTHPSYEKKKIYQVTLDKPLTKADMDTIAEGIELEDGEIHADAISYVGESRKDVGIEIHSGRNRIVRRIFEHLGYHVNKLDRVYFAGLTKQRLKRGQWRFLTPREVQALRSGRYE